ncbi:geranylgeranyl pyrophosphate synthetase [Xylariales sp. AK1849]|nr:geranylgeranyl pyrophosphate synthetase [Xylariales sp. AK1849]
MQYNYGRGRPYQRGGQRGGRDYRQRREAPTTPELPLGPLIKEVKPEDLASSAASFKQTACITDCSVVASWNWTNTKHPEMLIPGMPAQWTPLRQPQKLPEDNGEYFRDRNAARYPKHPMEPAIVAALKESPESCGSAGVDLVACSSTLGNLLRFVRGEDKPFRMLVEKVGETVFFVRREKSPTEKILDVYGFGHTFPEAYTTWNSNVKTSTSHQRVLRYSFGGLNCFVRFEPDGYIPNNTKNAGAKSTKARVDLPVAPDKPLASLNAATITSEESISSGGLQFREEGTRIPQDQIFDLKTRSYRKKDHDTTNDELPRLWVTQLDKFILAHHNSGVFNDIRVIDVRERISEWEKSNIGVLSRLAALIHRIRDMVCDAAGGKLEVCHMFGSTGVLQIRQQLPGAGDVLSPEVTASWIAGQDDSDYEPSDSESDLDESSEGGVDWNDPGEDFTACSAACDYCGRCAALKKI